MRIRSRTAAVALTLVTGAALAPPPALAEDKPVLVFAAASLKNALSDIAARWEKDTGKRATLSFAASGPLAKQIEQGAPADIFVSADLEWMDYVDQRKLLKTGSRANLLGNSLVLVAPADTSAGLKLDKGADLAGLLGDGRLAIGDVRSVPAGRYAEQALTALGIWEKVKDKLAQSESVRSTLALVARGEAKAGIVYGTDAKVEPKVKVLATFPATSHLPIVYPVAQLAASANPDAGAFLAFLHGPAAAAIFGTYGFVLCGQIAICGKAA
ncbi:molybdate ABC transporter substrate-binding protein [Chelatococcus reniformis]|uniref:Molybdate ABC transporter substrate-binding protein n=1 Tax=Chelatococcus reniformis TaxID=1494448 RepID=A0A916UBR9_9HYPH|nr:molybdate ABC transporter substrate-binding protein [Chelatococcus reniformis]GGC66537.1 molybdate ABC transporter substrate-binding protein [Chelatococcus reniformis]